MKTLFLSTVLTFATVSFLVAQTSNSCFESLSGKKDAKSVLSDKQFKDYSKWLKNTEKFAHLNPCYNASEKRYPTPLDRSCAKDLSIYESGDQYLYVTAIGESLGHQESLTNAKIQAREALEIDRMAYINVGVTRYVRDEAEKSTSAGSVVSNQESLNQLEREVTQIARGFTANVILVCNETYRTEEGYYKTYVRMAMDKDALYKKLVEEAEVLSGKLELEFDKDSFSKKLKGKYDEYVKELEKERKRLKNKK